MFSWVRWAPLPSPLRNCWSQESTVWTHLLFKGSLKTDHWELRSSKLEFSEVKKVGSRPFVNIQYRINLVIAIQTSILKNLSMRVFSQSNLKSIWEKTEYLRFKFRISYFSHFDQIPIPACSHICPAKMSLWNWYDGQRAKILPRHQNGYMI